MNLRKNNVSYVAWILLLFFTGASSAFFGLVLAQMVNINAILAAGGLVTLFFVVMFGLYLLIGILLERSDAKINWLKVLDFSPKLERVLIFSLLLLGFIARILLLQSAGEEAAYFEVCKVTGADGIQVQSVQGSVYFYCLLLHGLFHVVGNHWIAGIWLQVLLQLLGATFICLGLKKIINKIPAYLVFACILFSPSGIKAGLTYSPQVLYFCIFSGVFYFVADYLNRSMEQETSKRFMWIYTVLVGALIGVCCYMDISGILLLLLWGVLPMVKRREYTTIWNIRLPIGIAITMLTTLVIVFVDALISNTSIGNILHAWGILYGSVDFNYEILVSKLSPDIIFLIILSCMGCFSFWRRANTERFTPFIFMAVCMGIFVFGGITTENMSGSYLLFVCLSMLASVSVTELFCNEDLVKLRTERSKEIVKVEQEVVKKVEFIENPLPLPKKHVRKTMDYAFVPEEIDMKYDVFVSDNDDFDLK